MGAQTWLGFHGTLVNSAVRFAPIHGTYGSDATETNVQSLAASAGNLTSFTVTLSAAPGAGKSYRFQVSVNAAASTTLDLTISDAATTGTVSGTVAISAGDLLTVKVTPTGTPATGSAQYATEFDPTTANAFTYPCVCAGSRTVTAANVPGYYPAFVTYDATATTFTTASIGRASVAPFAGTITAIYVNLGTTPGGGSKSWDFIIEVNDVEQGSALNVTTTTGNQTGLSIAVVAGDKVVFKIKAATDTPATTIMRFGVVFVPTTAGDFAWCGSTTSVASTAAVRYLRSCAGTTGTAILSATETDVQATVPTTLYQKAMYVIATTAPGTGNTWTFTSRIGAGAGAISLVLADAATTGNDTDSTDNLVVTNAVNNAITPASTPDAIGGFCWATRVTTDAGVVTMAPPPLRAQVRPYRNVVRYTR